MATLGQFDSLTVTDVTDHGVTLDGGELGELNYSSDAEESLEVGDELRVFVYHNNHGELATTTRAPLAELGQIAWMKIVEVNDSGAFAHWGLPKDLFIPFGEQQLPLREDSHSLVMVYIDNQGRITGSTRIDRRLEDDSSGFRVGQQVSVLIGDRTELGYKAIVDNRCWGLLYANELQQAVRKGETHSAYVKYVRPDGKLDLTLEKPGYSRDKIDGVAQRILAVLVEHDGHIMLSDKSPPEAIKSVFGVSKKVFKQAVGALYKQRRITLDGTSMSLTEDPASTEG
jgi:predicted RNA-binding protein (virulence factor B family)